MSILADRGFVRPLRPAPSGQVSDPDAQSCPDSGSWRTLSGSTSPAAELEDHDASSPGAHFTRKGESFERKPAGSPARRAPAAHRGGVPRPALRLVQPGEPGTEREEAETDARAVSTLGPVSRGGGAPGAVRSGAPAVREIPVRRTGVRHVPAAAPPAPGRTARERRGEPLRPPTRERVVAGRRGGPAGCPQPRRAPVRWPWLIAVAAVACLFVSALGIFAGGVTGGPVPERTASVSVRSGDTLNALAARYAPNADQAAMVTRIKQLNDLDDAALTPGFPLTVPIAGDPGGL
ncbi:LysM domain-containing protein [Amycolatopsis sulphurea]|uniref:LysM domain-containing protein n=1 Tax=Amycolatopsis sulphurea TaxID=76022 RepID=A0A2A9F770_9PSEU|nr:LysM domain-containing protein [Amycolatopsis sulphurea]